MAEPSADRRVSSSQRRVLRELRRRGQGFRAGAGPVERSELGEEHVRRPAVADEVVRRQEEDVPLAPEHDEAEAQRGSRHEVERRLGLRVDERSELPLPRGRVERGEVRERHVDREARRDAQDVAFGGERRAQRVVAVDESLEGAREPAGIERAVEREGHGLVEGARRVLAHARREPDLALRFRERDDGGLGVRPAFRREPSVPGRREEAAVLHRRDALLVRPQDELEVLLGMGRRHEAREALEDVHAPFAQVREEETREALVRRELVVHDGAEVLDVRRRRRPSRRSR